MITKKTMKADIDLVNCCARVIAFYLPQFHPIPENDEWWGNGFTEWTNVAKAKPLFRGHYEPHIPADLGFYDLRVPEIRAAQAEMAREYGIEGFCYWHYWFAGKRLIERPFNEVLRSGEPDFPFCLAWANDSWTGIWHGAPNKILIEQTYPGMEDHEKHFYTFLEAFSDDRYLKVDGKPIFVVYKPRKLPDAKRVTDFWRELAHRSGLKGLHLVAVLQSESIWDPKDYGFDSITISNQTKIADVMGMPSKSILTNTVRRYLPILRKKMVAPPPHLQVYSYKKALPYFLEEVPEGIEYYPCLVPNWDNTPRSALRGIVLHGSNPELFRIQVKEAVSRVLEKQFDNRIIFVKSWNEWAEGNHLEPDLKFGKGYLKVLREEVCDRT